MKRKALLFGLLALAGCASSPAKDAADAQRKLDKAAAQLASPCLAETVVADWRGKRLDRWFDFHQYEGRGFRDERRETYFRDPQAPIYIRPIRGGYRMIIADVEPETFEAALTERLQGEGFEPQDSITLAVCAVAHHRGQRYCEAIGGPVVFRAEDTSTVRSIETMEQSPLGVSLNLTLQTAPETCE